VPDQPYRPQGPYDPYDQPPPHPDGPAPDTRRPADSRAQAQASYYPGRRMNLGVVLLPLRVFLGFISIYAGMGKLCDPVYFDGGERGSMVTWLRTLHPWALAEPLRDFALAHPVGAGLTVAFLQVIVGVLTVFGLWQRFAACIGALLSAALLMTVSWKTVPAYDAPDIIYLAAWSPLIIAGAPVYSLDGRLAGEAWRTLGPRSEMWQLRRRVLRRGTVMATVVCGLTLLIGSLLGGAVRSSTVVTVPGPGQAPSNYLPGPRQPPAPAPRPPAVRAGQAAALQAALPVRLGLLHRPRRQVRPHRQRSPHPEHRHRLRRPHRHQGQRQRPEPAQQHPPAVQPPAAPGHLLGQPHQRHHRQEARPRRRPPRLNTPGTTE
ncbi:DoxX family protein, partial [Streptomyces katrae]|uniref:DoxX family protein n=1 Tax=Streptomyces katrae TaxID=68223 RepID=UPI000A645D1B